MSSSSQFSIRALMIVTVMVAVVSALVGPWIREMPPEVQFRLGGFFVCLAAVVACFVALRLGQRYRAEQLAGPRLWQTDAGEKAERWALLVPTLMWGTVAFMGIGILAAEPGVILCFRGLVFGIAIVGSALQATRFFFYWWWQTTPYVTEICQNGLIQRGVRFRPWTALTSYRPSPKSPAVLIVTEQIRRSKRPRNVYVARQDRARLGRTLSEKGVPPAVAPNHSSSKYDSL